MHADLVTTTLFLITTNVAYGFVLPPNDVIGFRSARPATTTTTAFRLNDARTRHCATNEQNGIVDVITSSGRKVAIDRQKMTWTAVVAATVLTWTTTFAPLRVDAYYAKDYPEELVSVDGISDGRSRRRERVLAQEAEKTAAVTLGPNYKPISAVLWGSALWFLSGSRSNPVATPLANALYDEREEQWLEDRNEGLFADLPLPFLVVLGIVFAGIGWGADAIVVSLADGDRNISLQLAGVSLITGASLELGRVASGEKAPTRDEAERNGRLWQEFNEFAEKRLALGGNCHRSDVVGAFRRYFAKYRRSDSEEFPLTDIEIERLLKVWARVSNANIETTSSGFYYGIQINKDADAFA